MSTFDGDRMANAAETEGAVTSGGGGLGLEKSEVRLVPHDPSWMVLGELECATVAELLGDAAIDVVHVGSTSVPDLEAKPILDIAAAVPDDTAIDEVVARLGARGDYSYDGDRGGDGGQLFVREHGAVRTVHVHVVGRSSQAWDDYLRFRARLVNDPAARQRYEAAKRVLAERFAHDRPGYTLAKGAVVEELLGDEGPPPRPQPD
ncbi:MAG TPA: GrpB family protein [Acidimicrobiales bacterium]|nr:GrpB family protein [Acidimicrobiales bacterium]